MRLIGSFIFLVIWFPTFIVAFPLMVFVCAFVDAYRLAAKAQEWLYDY